MIGCIHAGTTLCPSCQEQFEEDPLAWWEYGDHPEGIKNTQALWEQLARDAEVLAQLPPPVIHGDIPF